MKNLQETKITSREAQARQYATTITHLKIGHQSGSMQLKMELQTLLNTSLE